MKLNSSLWGCWKLAVLLLSVSTFAGNETGNGTDNKKLGDGSAWFLGSSKVIRYCYELSPEFGLSNASIEGKIKKAFEVWSSYISERKVETSFPPQYGISFATQSSRLPSCDGSEDMKFYFGTSNSEVQRYKSKYENPTAFATRTQYDIATGWGKGFVWLAPSQSVSAPAGPATSGTSTSISGGFPDWTRGHVLEGILIHELGHVFGCGHYVGTIMDENLSSQIQIGHYPEPQLLKIDFQRQLVNCWMCALEYVGDLGWTPSDSADNSGATFLAFTGRAASGPVKAKLVGDSIRKNIRLTITDDLGTVTIPFKFGNINQTPFFNAGTSLFKAVSPLTDHASLYYGSYGATLYGSAMVNSGGSTRTFNVMLELNSSGLGSEKGPINIKYFGDNNKVSTLFRGFPQ